MKTPHGHGKLVALIEFFISPGFQVMYSMRKKLHTISLLNEAN